MTRPMHVVVVALGAGLSMPAGALGRGQTHEVRAMFSDFGPAAIDILPGETVEWVNVSERRHTVTASDGAFDSGDLEPRSRFAHRYDSVGAFHYHCSIHPGMRGSIGVRRVILGPLPPAAVPAGEVVAFTGRTGDPSRAVTVERDDGRGFRAVAVAAPAHDGLWKVDLEAESTADYRATVDNVSSQTRRLLVSNRKVIVRATRRGIAVRVVPAAPYERVRLQAHRRERFGWWPERTRRLDYLSEATFRTRYSGRVRVVLVDRDGWTPIATSRVLALGPSRRPRAPRRPPAHHRGAA